MAGDIERFREQLGLAPGELVMSPELEQEFLGTEREAPDESYYKAIPGGLQSYLGRILCDRNQTRHYYEAGGWGGEAKAIVGPYDVLARPQDRNEATYPLIRAMVSRLACSADKYLLIDEDFVIHAVTKKISHRSRIIEAQSMPNGNLAWSFGPGYPPRIDRRRRNEYVTIVDLGIYLNNQYEAQGPDLAFNRNAWQTLIAYRRELMHRTHELPIANLKMDYYS